MEPEVLLTETILQFLGTVVEEIPDSCEEKHELKKVIEKSTDSKNIPFRLVKFAYNQNAKTGKKKVYLNELLQDSDLHLPEVKIPPRNPELEARIQKLKWEQDNKKYREITKNVAAEEQNPNESIAADVKIMNNQLIAVFNFIITVGGAFAFGYKATEYMFQGFGVDTFPAQLCMGLILATVVFFADLYFLLKSTS